MLVCRMLIIMTVILMTVTTIPAGSKIIPNTNSACLSFLQKANCYRPLARHGFFKYNDGKCGMA